MKVNYQYYYDELIKVRGQSSKPKGYSERHHILPKSMSGTDNKENLTYLSFNDHCFAHWLLWKIHRNKSMAYSYYMMMKRKLSNPNPTVEQAAQTNKGRTLSDDHKKKIGLSQRGVKKPEGFGKNLSNKLNELHHLARKVMVDGVVYKSNRKAGEALGKSHRTIARMIERGEAFLVTGE